MTLAGHIDQRLVRCRSRKTREAIYAAVARDYGQGFADSIRDTFEAHHLVVENRRAIMRPRSISHGNKRRR